MTPSVSATVDKVSLRALEKELLDLNRQFEEQVSRELYLAADGAMVDARSTDLFNDRTGSLRGSIGFEGRSPFEVQFQAKARHASFIENGTPPHIIEAKRKVLSFVVNGRRVFTKRVNHPGTAKRPFMQIAADAAGERLAERIELLATRTFER